MCAVNAWLLYDCLCKQFHIDKHISMFQFKSDITEGLLHTGGDELKIKKVVHKLKHLQQQKKDLAARPSENV